MRDKNIEKIQNLLNNQKIIKTKLISSSFGINCLKIKTSSEKNFIVKLYKNKKNKFNSIIAEAKNLIFLNKKLSNPNFLKNAPVEVIEKDEHRKTSLSEKQAKLEIHLKTIERGLC